MTNYLVEHWMELYKSAFAWSRLWKRAAKKWYRRALSWQAWGEAHEALADKRLVLLKKSKIYFDWFVFEYETDHIEGFDLLMSELAEAIDG